MILKTSRRIESLKNFVYFLLLLFPFAGIAQNKPGPISPILTGKIIDGQTHQPIPSATIIVLHKDSSVATETISKSDGDFTLKNLPEDPYILQITVVGYQPFSKAVPRGRRGAGAPLNTGTIRLTPMAAEMQTAVVTASRPVFRTEIDKKVFNVTNSLASKGGTAQDALRQVPTLQVDAMGNVSLRNGSPTILLDGKQTQLTLDQIPADQIESIEVMPNPSAKYDAQGNHGIVNIVLKRNRKPGLNGNFTGVWNSLHETYGFANMNVYKHKWNFSLNYMAHSHRSVSNTITALNDFPSNTSVIQRGHAVTTGPFQSVKAGLDFNMDPLNTFSVSEQIGFGHHPTTGTQVTDYQEASGLLDSTSTRSSYANNNFVFTHSNFDYAHTFKKHDEKLTADAALETYENTNNGRYAMQYLDKGGSDMGSPYLQQYQGSGQAHNITL